MWLLFISALLYVRASKLVSSTSYWSLCKQFGSLFHYLSKPKSICECSCVRENIVKQTTSPFISQKSIRCYPFSFFLPVLSLPTNINIAAPFEKNDASRASYISMDKIWAHIFKTSYYWHSLIFGWNTNAAFLDKTQMQHNSVCIILLCKKMLIMWVGTRALMEWTSCYPLTPSLYVNGQLS